MAQLKAKLGEEWITVGGVGEGVPAGGAPGQMLVKASAADYITQWVNQPAAPPPQSPRVLAWAYVNADGTLAASQGVGSVSKTAPGVYEVTLSPVPASAFTMTANSAWDGSITFVTVAYASASVIRVRCWSSDEDALDMPFTLIVAGV